MTMFRAARPLCTLALLTSAGCSGAKLQRYSQTPQQQVALAQQYEAVQTQHRLTDRYNEELLAASAQKDQQIQLLQDQLAATREQLAGASDQLARALNDQQATEKKAEALVASTRRRVGARITANNSLAESLPAFTLPGVQARRDGDLVRIELPADELFEPASAQLRPGAGRILDTVSEELARSYPGLRVGIEGHTDGQPLHGGAWTDHHQLSTARASAVYGHLAARGTLKPAQLTVSGFGANEPLMANDNPAGQQRNRRIELVVYPEPAR
jgi:flagellar motor protein MotB